MSTQIKARRAGHWWMQQAAAAARAMAAPAAPDELTREFDRITAVTGCKFGYAVAELRAPGRHENRRAFVRGVAMLLMRELTRASAEKIAVYFQHTPATVYFQTRTVRDVISVHASDAARVAALRAELSANPQ